MAIALKYCSKKDDANEAVNDSFMKVFESIQSFEISRTYLFRAKRELRQLYQTCFIENHEKARSE